AGTTRARTRSTQRRADPLDRTLLDGVRASVVLCRCCLALVSHRRRQQHAAYTGLARHLRVRAAESVRRHDRYTSRRAAPLHRPQHPMAVHLTEQPIVGLLPLRQLAERWLEHPWTRNS